MTSKEMSVLLQKPKNRAVSIRVSEADLQAARQQAAKKGLPYQTYVKMLLHEALATGTPPDR